MRVRLLLLTKILTLPSSANMGYVVFSVGQTVAAQLKNSSDFEGRLHLMDERKGDGMVGPNRMPYSSFR